MKQVESIYRELRSRISAQSLQEVSVYLIARYRRRDHDTLSRFARLVGVESADAGRLFARLIQLYHPDKLGAILHDLDESYRGKNLEALARMRSVYMVDLDDVRRAWGGQLDYEEEFAFADDDFGYEEESFEEAYPEEDETGECDEEEYATDDDLRDGGGFIDALNRLFFGGLDASVTKYDLKNIDGALDVSDLEIEDLSGIEHCVNLVVLNLAGNDLVKISALAGLVRLESLFLSENSIEDIGCLAGLVNLRELDISFNCVEDVPVLRFLPALEYVNVVGNPLRDASALDEIEAKGVIFVR
jgi:hypothetical protein